MKILNKLFSFFINNKLKKTTTIIGFTYYRFEDNSGNECSLQESPSFEQSIWIGSNKIGIKEFVAYRQPSPWVELTQFDEPCTTEHAYVANNRMHLSRKHVAKLLPILQKFVETGEI